MYQVQMENMKAAPLQEGEQPKSDVEVVAAVLASADCKSSTFLMNVRLKSSTNKAGKSNVVVAAHVRDLEDKLDRSREEVAMLKKRSEDSEAAQVARDKEFELLRKKTEENDARYAYLMALLGGKGSGNC